MATCDMKAESVEIGILEEQDSWLLESRFFPSKVGGKPAWLILEPLPPLICCDVCSKPAIFLCQIYAPLEDSAYHRTLFLFICRNPACCIPNKSGNLRLLRCQLPKTNRFYPEEEPIEEPTWHPEAKVENFSQTCCICGQFSKFKCGKCLKACYCSSHHQIYHWKHGHKEQCFKDNEMIVTLSDVLFREYEIVIELEKPSNEDELKSKTEEECLQEFQDLVTSQKAGTIPNLPEDFIENFSNMSVDKVFKVYHNTIKACPEQIIRFKRDGSPLYVRKPSIEETAVPNCELCGGRRIFEFQILSTFLNDLDLDDLGQSIDWGTILCYTCEQSCDLGPSYKQEFVRKQDFQC